MVNGIDPVLVISQEQLARLRSGDLEAYLAAGDDFVAAWNALENSGEVPDVALLQQLEAACASIAAEAGLRMNEISQRLARMGQARTAATAYLSRGPASGAMLHHA